MENEALLQSYGIKPTALRLLIIKSIKLFTDTFSLDELYLCLETVDKSTVFRTITLFEKHKLLHGFEDGMGKRKYCLCKSTDNSISYNCNNESYSNHEEECQNNHYSCHHAHITCRICGHTYCLPSHHTPEIDIPLDFEVEDVNYIVTGICSNCKKKL